MTKKFEDIPIIEITEETFLSLLDSTHLFTLDRYLKNWVMVEREIGMIIKHVITRDKITHVKPILLRMKLI